MTRLAGWLVLALGVAPGCCLGNGAPRAPVVAAAPTPPPPSPEERHRAVEAAASTAAAAQLDDAGHLAEAERIIASDATSVLELEDFAAVAGHLDALSAGYETRRVRAARHSLAGLEREYGQTMLGVVRGSIRSGDFAMARSAVADIPAGSPAAHQQAALLRQIQHGEEHAAAMELARGPRPEVVGDTPLAVYAYLHATANDPGSIDIQTCGHYWTEELGRQSWWTVDCLYRGRNAFGGLVLDARRFYIQQGNVVRTERVSHPR